MRASNTLIGGYLTIYVVLVLVIYLCHYFAQQECASSMCRSNSCLKLLMDYRPIFKANCGWVLQSYKHVTFHRELCYTRMHAHAVWQGTVVTVCHGQVVWNYHPLI